MADEGAPASNQPPAAGGAAVIIVKKKKKAEEHGHHGGAWEVAYADFVTAMMAFFLLLWLLSSTTEEQKQGIASYFNPPNNSTQFGGGDGIMGGESPIAADQHAPQDAPAIPPTPEQDTPAIAAKEDAMFKQVAEQLKKSVMNIPELQSLMDNLQVDITPEGLRIQITDSGNRPLFEPGKAAMYPYTERMLSVMATVLAPLPNKLAVGGYTDSVPYHGPNANYSNWELSSDRAQNARKTLVKEGLIETRMNRVAGYASQEPLLTDQPEDPKNSRLSIVVLRAKRAPVAAFSQNGLLAPQ